MSGTATAARVGHGGIPDVVAVATRQDRGALNKAFMGSTSAAVARNCPAATLLVRSRVGPGSPAAGAEPPTGAALTGPATGAPSKVTEGAALAVTATLAAAAARAAAAEAEKRVALELVAASGGDEQAEKARARGAQRAAFSPRRPRQAGTQPAATSECLRIRSWHEEEDS